MVGPTMAVECIQFKRGEHVRATGGAYMAVCGARVARGVLFFWVLPFSLVQLPFWKAVTHNQRHSAKVCISLLSSSTYGLPCQHRCLVGLGTLDGSNAKCKTTEMVPCGIGHPVRHVPLWCDGLAKKCISIIILRPPLAGVVGGYNHHCIGEEVEWRPPLLRPPLLYAYPLGHRVLASLKIPGTCEEQHTKHSTWCARGALGSLTIFVPLSMEDQYMSCMRPRLTMPYP